jgi:ubiquitin carboxyl-terminal hydrolase 1
MAARVGLHAAKGEVMSRILGLSSNNLLSGIKRARAMSGIGIGNAFSATRSDVPPGLGNWDNSCYQNSVIQGFASLSSLSEFLERNIETLGKKGALDTHKSLRDIIGCLNDQGNYGRRFWNPDELKSMSSWQQQDAQEYFSKVVDQVDKEVGKAMKGKTDDLGLKERRFSTDVSNASLTLKALSTSTLREALDAQDYFRNPLEGLLAQRVGCMRCGFTEGLSLIPFNCLTVPLSTAWRQDVRDCLDEYTALEPIEGVECGKCTLLKVHGHLKQISHQINNEQIQNEEGQSTISDALKASVEQRMNVIETALQEEDFSENTLKKKCNIPSRNRVSTTKSRQAVIARPPRSLVLHLNRSLFDELTGAQRKNYADVQFPKTLDLSEWCLGTKTANGSGSVAETWEMDPSKSMLNLNDPNAQDPRPLYELRAAVQHLGRHENGHYICYRKYPARNQMSTDGEEYELQDKVPKGQWWRLSDDDVSMVSEDEVLNVGGVFMLFYEVTQNPSCPERLDIPVVTSNTNTVPTALVALESSDELAVSNFRVDEIEQILSAAWMKQTRSDTPQTVIDLRIDQPVPSSSSKFVANTDTQPEDGEATDLDDSSHTPRSSYSSNTSTPPPEDYPAPTSSPPKTFTPVMRTSSIPDNTTGSRGGGHRRNVPSMVTAI